MFFVVSHFEMIMAESFFFFPQNNEKSMLTKTQQNKI